ncbi:MAG: hypothetical protein WCI83_07005 [Thermoleophilia bacterium]
MNFRGRRITAALLAGGAMFTGAGIGSAIAANSNQAGTTSTTPAEQRPSQAGGRHHQHNPAVKAAVQKLLGVNDAAMRTARDSGQTLAQFAATKGVSQADLVSTIVSALKASKPAGAPALSDAQLTEKVTQRVTSTRAEGNQGPRRGNDQVRAKVGAAIASTLGITTAELKAAHKAGTTPATLASQKGVAKADLVSAVSTVLKANKPANAPAMTDAQLTQKATNIVDGVHPGPGGPGGSHSQGRR